MGPGRVLGLRGMGCELIEMAETPMGHEVLHCYAQYSWHMDAYISGSRDALVMLRDAIDAALNTGVAECEVFASDGEGYSIYVVAMSDADAKRQVVPYTSYLAAEDWNGNAFGPWRVLMPSFPMQEISDALGHNTTTKETL